MIATVALARDFHQPIGLRALQMGKLLLDALVEERAAPKRFLVRDWLPSDGGVQWTPAYPCSLFASKYFTIVRLTDNAKYVAPRHWWACDPRGMPRDDDSWAEGAWRAIERHYIEQRKWCR